MRRGSGIDDVGPNPLFFMPGNGGAMP